MFTSVINLKMKPGTRDQFMEFGRDLKDRLADLTGIRQFIIIDLGDDSCLILAKYDSKEQWEAAGPKAQALLGEVAPLAAAPPAREGGEVLFDYHYG